jgi:hypothetical protein
MFSHEGTTGQSSEWNYPNFDQDTVDHIVSLCPQEYHHKLQALMEIVSDTGIALSQVLVWKKIHNQDQDV